ncbi:TRAFs-binding domain-containing protein [Paraburkholderia sp. BR10882]|uniref:TRAFs-binding domain-containing protein n=1 Tax=unclassified Paraburkholderia TaxID=2615204 RepID=UPI0034CF1AFC
MAREASAKMCSSIVKRVWRNIKYEEVYLKAYEFLNDAQCYRRLYCTVQSATAHWSLLDQKPDEAGFATLPAIQIGSMAALDVSFKNLRRLPDRAGSLLTRRRLHNLKTSTSPTDCIISGLCSFCIESRKYLRGPSLLSKSTDTHNLAPGKGNAPRQTCFIDMPFGVKVDAKTGGRIDFDQIYTEGIEPAVRSAGLECIRGDREETGGLIHTAMFARLLVAEFVVADMTTANPNVFYELGVRHAARPYSTIPIFATVGAPPFDVNGVRAIPYDLNDGKLTPDASGRLVAAIKTRIEAALKSPVAPDSPLFQLFDRYPGISMSHEVADVFRDRVNYAAEFRGRLAVARSTKPRTDAVTALKVVETDIGNVATAERGVVVDLLLSYRAAEAYTEMVALYERMSGDLQTSVIARQQMAFALNRRNALGDRDRALTLIEGLRRAHGDSAETLGILGRIYKDLWREAKSRGSLAADGFLDQAIETYMRGFSVEPLDYYPGVNALTLLVVKGDEEAMANHAHLAPLVTFAALRKGGAQASDYWTLATMIELGCHNRNFVLARNCLSRAVSHVQKSSEAWMLKTTSENLTLIADRYGEPDSNKVRELAKLLDKAHEQVEMLV